MAVQDAVFSRSGEPDIVFSILAGAVSGEKVIGPKKIFAINATDDIHLAWGQSGSVPAPAATTHFRIPKGLSIAYWSGSDQAIRVLNPTAATVNVFIQILSKG